MKYLFGSLISGLFGLAIATNGALAQSRVDLQQVINSLVSTSSTARHVGFDTAAVRRDVEKRIRAEGGENARRQFSVIKELKRLPQLIVQIQFQFDSDVIQPSSWVTVGHIADALHHPLLSGNRFLIVGHTDAKGKRLYNFELSQNRAQSVADMLVSVFRVNPKRLLVMGLGEEQLRDTAKPNASINRRVELLNLGPI